VFQLVFSDPELKQRGDCLRACVASLFELHPRNVPHFADFPQDAWVYEFLRFVAEAGYEYFGWIDDQTFINDPALTQGVDGYVIVVGESPRSLPNAPPMYHAVLYKNGYLAHDPHPSGLGITHFSGFHVIERKDIAIHVG